MNVKISDLLVDLFFAGGIFIVHYTACKTKEEIYVVETLEQEVVFEITKRWFDKFRALHTKMRVQTLPCGCIQRTVIPNGQEFTPSGFNFHMN